MDAETGEALPYVSVQLANGRGTLTNSDGDFTIKALGSDTLKFQCIGYVAQRIVANRIHGKLKMAPLVTQMDELTVLSMSAIMDRVYQQLRTSLKKGDAEHSSYFCRIIEEVGGGTDMIEAIVDAKSMVHLRDIKLIAGRQALLDAASSKRPSLTSMNMHHILEVGPMMNFNAFWNELIVPPFNDKNYRRIYTWKYHTTGSSDGGRMYVIDMSSNVRTGGGRIMEGKAYVDAKSHHLLRFVAKVPSILMLNKTGSTAQTTEVTTTITIDYTYGKRGMAEVSNISFDTRGTNVHSKGLVYRIDNIRLANVKSGIDIGENMLASIRQAGFDSLMWNNSNIVRRTKEEELLSDRTLQHPQADVMDAGLTSIYRNLKRAEWFPGQEKVYLHMDNTSYLLGDTLWFSAYTAKSGTCLPSDISGVLYVELVNHDGYPVERKKVEMKHGHGYGFFALNGENMRSGYCELRAYSLWQLNWGGYEKPHRSELSEMFIDREKEKSFFRDYEKLYSRVFPVLERDGRKMTGTSHTGKDANRTLLLKLYPEGGSLLAGVRNRIAFEAMWDDGEAADGYVIVGTDTVRTENRGRGAFFLTPMEDKEYPITFTSRNGETTCDTLPLARKNGVALTVTQRDSMHRITCRVSGGLDPSHLALSIRHADVLEDFIPLAGITASADSFVCEFNHQSRNSGIRQVTVFDGEGHIYTDRLFFVRQGTGTSCPLEIRGLKTQYEPYERIQADIRLNGNERIRGTALSISFRDTESCLPTYDHTNILAEILLASEIRGYVPNASWFFESNDVEHQRALDLLMMTQGWRRYDWTETALPRQNQKVILREDDAITLWGRAFHKGPAITKANRRESKNEQGYHADMSKEAYIHAMIMDESGKEKLPHLQTDNGGYFKLRIPRFSGNCLLFLGATKLDPYQLVSHRWETSSATDKQSEDQSYILLDVPFPRFSKPFSFYQNHLPVNGDVTILPSNGSCPYVMDAMTTQNDILDAGLKDKADSFSADSIQKYIFYTTCSPRAAEFADSLFSMRVSKVPYPNGDKRIMYRDRMYLLDGFAYPAQFYSPDYSKQALPEGLGDYRRTLYWNPDLQLDENGEATVTFYNNSRTTHLSVEAEGQAADGTLLWGREE